MSGLGSVFKRSKERQVLETPVLEVAPTFERVVQKARVKVGRRSLGYTQWNVLIPEEVKIEAQIRCTREKRDMADVTEKLLAAWLRGELNV